jgi:hypothetical protein
VISSLEVFQLKCVINFPSLPFMLHALLISLDLVILLILVKHTESKLRTDEI